MKIVQLYKRVHFLDTLWVEKFQRNNYFARLRPICVFPFWAKIRKFKMAAICGEGKIFFKLQRVCFLDTLWIENFDEITLSRTVKKIEENSCFAIFGKNSKIQNGRHFWGGENFLKIAKSTFLRYPMGQKFDEIALSRTVKEIEANLCFAIFWQKFENSKWPPFLGRGKFFENCKEHIP